MYNSIILFIDKKHKSDEIQPEKLKTYDRKIKILELSLLFSEKCLIDILKIKRLVLDFLLGLSDFDSKLTQS